ncbi:MAG: transporter substrate-binding domain-containing protein [Rhodospirillaceae bacterium]|nr:transporter substrate-binding domain-containing protein [Rhodospirillaceae bacterium]
MKIKSILFAAVAALSINAASTSANAAETVRIGTEGAYPPFNQIGPSGRVEGFDIDIAKALCAEMDVKCLFVVNDWDTIITGLQQNKYDAIVASMSITAERKKAVDFTDRYYSNTLSIVAKKGSNISMDSLKGKNVGAQRATISAQYLEDSGSGAELKLYDTQENAWLDLASGRIDAIVADTLPSADWISSDAGKGFAIIGDAIDIDDEIGIAVRKGDRLRGKLNAAIAAIRKNGTYKAINDKYFAVDIY